MPNDESSSAAPDDREVRSHGDAKTEEEILAYWTEERAKK